MLGNVDGRVLGRIEGIKLGSIEGIELEKLGTEDRTGFDDGRALGELEEDVGPALGELEGCKLGKWDGDVVGVVIGDAIELAADTPVGDDVGTSLTKAGVVAGELVCWIGDVVGTSVGSAGDAVGGLVR